MELPERAGLYRRLAYGELIRQRAYDRQRYVRNLSAIGMSLERDYNRVSPRREDSYEFLSSLEPVRQGVTLKEITRNSILKVAKVHSFCVVCQESINPEKEEIVREINCLHFFHVECIDLWLSESKKCPLCNSEVIKII